jgi:hypothetical protein
MVDAIGSPQMANLPRVIIATPDLVECGTIADWLSAEGLEPVRRSNPRVALEEIQTRPFDLLAADAGFALRHGLHAASRVRKPQTPTVLMIGGGATDHCESSSRQFIYLPRPAERALVVCTISMAIADTRPVRCSLRKPAHRFEAIVNGVRSRIIDVSNEGLRLEVPRDRRTILPPYFNIQVPLIGVVVTVQRMWTKTLAHEGEPITWCGGALAPQNQVRATRAWRVFVDTIPVGGASSVDSLRVQ